jgi:dTDP-4-dehydrorhamnose 3,5-epimerase
MYTIEETNLKDALLIKPKVFGDNRGYFTETFNERVFKEDTGLDINWIQDNESYNAERGVIRGLHFQKGESSQSKLVRVVRGVVMDVIVDLREGSPTFGQHQGFLLNEQDMEMLYVPKGFAHGYSTLTNDVKFLYKVDNYYDPKSDTGITFLDKDLDISWAVELEKAIMSEKDKSLQTFEEYTKSSNKFIYKGVK